MTNTSRKSIQIGNKSYRVSASGKVQVCVKIMSTTRWNDVPATAVKTIEKVLAESAKLAA